MSRDFRSLATVPRLLAAIVVALFALTGVGAAASLSDKIKKKQGAISGQKAKEGVLTADISGYTSRIGSLQAGIAGLEAKQSRIQADLDTKLARLSSIQDDLRSERARLARLRAKLSAGRDKLAKRLVELYKADSPDLLSVVLNARGFAQLIEDGEFARRVGRQDNRILTTVRSAKAESTQTAAHLSGLEDDATQVAAAVQDRRDEVASVKDDLVGRRDAYASVRSEKRTVLASIQEDRHELEGDLRVLQAEEAKIQARLAGVPTGGPLPKSGSSGLMWPVNGTIVSPFGMRWGRLHAGVDIAIPSGTPVHAAQTGSVRIAGWVSGYGNYVCIQHAGTLSTCYGHNTSLTVHVGQSVAKGQVISSSGCTGHCFGPHVHFETRINGAPVDPMGYL